MKAPEVRSHESGLSTQEVTGPAVAITQTHTIKLPTMCPVSGNPRKGSTLTVTYQPSGWCLEVYSLRRVAKTFVGGFQGAGPYSADRNMEGAVATLAKMCADAVGVPVRATADLVLDAGGMTLTVEAVP